MKNKEAVLWLTLTDFLIQVIFFGIFLVVGYLVWEKTAESSKPTPLDPTRANDYAQGAGFSNYVELTDWLTTMVPASQLKSLFGDSKRVSVENDALRGENDKLRAELRKALGPPPCKESLGSDGAVRAVADVVGFDDHLEITRDTAAFRNIILPAIDKSTQDVRRLTFAEFDKAFAALPRVYNFCRFYVYFDDSNTQLKFARKTVENSFYLLTQRRAIPDELPEG